MNGRKSPNVSHLKAAPRLLSSRVAASVLHAVGLPEPVTVSLGEYEALAVVALARDPEWLARIKTKLMHNRDIEPSFDNRMQEGLAPTSFAADQVPVCTA